MLGADKATAVNKLARRKVRTINLIDSPQGMSKTERRDYNHKLNNI